MIRLVQFGCASALVLLAACDRTPSQAATLPSAAPEFEETLPPAIAPPTESTNPEPPSYEVAIATAAAERNQAKKKCAELPDIERRTCEEQADVAFGAAEADLADLRGNQQ